MKIITFGKSRIERQYDHRTRQIIQTTTVREEILSFLDVFREQGPMEVKKGHFYPCAGVKAGIPIGSQIHLEPVIEELERIGLVESNPDAWHPTYQLTECGKETAQAFHNPPKLSLGLLLHNTLEAGAQARRDAENHAIDALTVMGMEVEYATVTKHEDGRLLFKTRFLDDSGTEGWALRARLENHLGLPVSAFKDNPQELNLGWAPGNIWTLTLLGPYLDG